MTRSINLSYQIRIFLNHSWFHVQFLPVQHLADKRISQRNYGCDVIDGNDVNERSRNILMYDVEGVLEVLDKVINAETFLQQNKPDLHNTHTYTVIFIAPSWFILK